MKKSPKTAELTRLNRAAFRVDPIAIGSDATGRGLESALARVLGGISVQAAGCTTFTCNMYAPTPSPT